MGSLSFVRIILENFKWLLECSLKILQKYINALDNVADLNQKICKRKYVFMNNSSLPNAHIKRNQIRDRCIEIDLNLTDLVLPSSQIIP